MGIHVSATGFKPQLPVLQRLPERRCSTLASVLIVVVRLARRDFNRVMSGGRRSNIADAHSRHSERMAVMGSDARTVAPLTRVIQMANPSVDTDRFTTSNSPVGYLVRAFARGLQSLATLVLSGCFTTHHLATYLQGWAQAKEVAAETCPDIAGRYLNASGTRSPDWGSNMNYFCVTARKKAPIGSATSTLRRI